MLNEKYRKISYKGTWNVENEKLILNVKQEEIAEGGDITLDDPVLGDYLTDYNEVIHNVDYKLEYTASFSDLDGQEYLDLNDIELYKIRIEPKYVDIVKTLAENDYDAYKKKVSEYYDR